MHICKYLDWQMGPALNKTLNMSLYRLLTHCGAHFYSNKSHQRNADKNQQLLNKSSVKISLPELLEPQVGSLSNFLKLLDLFKLPDLEA